MGSNGSLEVTHTAQAQLNMGRPSRSIGLVADVVPRPTVAHRLLVKHKRSPNSLLRALAEVKVCARNSAARCWTTLNTAMITTWVPYRVEAKSRRSARTRTESRNEV